MQPNCLLDLGGYIRLYCQVQGATPSFACQGISFHWVRRTQPLFQPFKLKQIILINKYLITLTYSDSDAKDTIPIPEDGSTRFVNFKFEGDKTPWLDYASERKGRFVGLANKDGSTKTECGIHVAGAERTFDRDLWVDGKVQNIASNEEALNIINAGNEAVVVVYAPWCQFCQAMEEEYAKFAESATVPVYKFRGDEEREFVQEKLNTKSFPTVNFIKSDGSVVKYESEARTAADFADFQKSFEKTTA